MPIGTDLVIQEQAAPEEILLDGRRLGEIVAEAARRYHTPLAFPLMDLTLEKAVLLESLGVAPDDVAKFHFADSPGEQDVERLAYELPNSHNARWRAAQDAVEHIAKKTKLVPIGMVIGPLSLVVKLLADPIVAIYTAGRGRQGSEDHRVLALSRCLELATYVVLESVRRQVAAGARAIMVCEPAASTAYLSPRQLAAGSDLLENLVSAPNRRIRRLLDEAGCELIFHCCGELTLDFLAAFVQLRPVILSLGSSRVLWEDAAFVPKDIVLFGNLPTKSFYSDGACPIHLVEERSRQLVRKMHEADHPFILGSECDVLSVRGAHETIRAKVQAFMNVRI